MYYYGARYYDPRISIFVSVDPLAEDFAGWTPYHYVHNNPINLIDPTGMSAEGIETHFVNEKGETIANTDDGSNEVFVTRKENEEKFTKELSEKVKTKDDLKLEVNKELGEKYGYNLSKINEEGGKPNYPKEILVNDAAWEVGYKEGYDGSRRSLSMTIGGAEDKKMGVNYEEGRLIGRQHSKEEKMNIFSPVLKDEPAQNHIQTNRAPKVNHRKYSDKPIPLLID